MKLFRTCLLALGLVSTSASIFGQALPAATQAGQLQVGVGFSYGKTDEFPKAVTGVTAYGTFDLNTHLGAEADVHLMIINTPNDFVEDTYLAGLRYRWFAYHVQPYVKVLAGIGGTHIVDELGMHVPGTPGSYLAVGMGGGVDVPLKHRVNVRADLERQWWPGFPTNSLTPTIFTVGAAYRFR